MRPFHLNRTHTHNKMTIYERNNKKPKNSLNKCVTSQIGKPTNKMVAHKQNNKFRKGEKQKAYFISIWSGTFRTQTTNNINLYQRISSLGAPVSKLTDCLLFMCRRIAKLSYFCVVVFFFDVRRCVLFDFVSFFLYILFDRFTNIERDTPALGPFWDVFVGVRSCSAMKCNKILIF